MNADSIEIGGDGSGRGSIRAPQAVALGRDDGVIIMALMLDTPDQIYRAIFKCFVENDPVELIFGLDRFCRPEQGTHLQDLLSVHHFREGIGWRFGIMEYQAEPRIVRPIEWENPFWTQALNSETMGMFARMRRKALRR